MSLNNGPQRRAVADKRFWTLPPQLFTMKGMDSIPISEARKAQLEALARQQGKDLAVAADDVLALGLDLAREEQDIREMLDRRYDDVVNGKAHLLDPDDVRRELKARHAAYQPSRG